MYYLIFDLKYCIGLFSQMPEEQAFGVLVKIMFDYNLRDFFKNDFEMLHLHFYQLERLLQVQSIHMGEQFQGYSRIQDFEADFPKKVSLKILNWADYNSFSDLFSVI